ncbi:hypothetical protein [Microbispora sp. NPDC049125]|uniref:hypothetical protein n=1 Tax=Microbispora sp. NPDC049125 TaxID=3154929 RepID=UPI0034679F94
MNEQPERPELHDAHAVGEDPTPGAAYALGQHYPVRLALASQPEAVMVDIIEERSPLRDGERDPGERCGPEGLHIPTHVLINGQPIYMPRGAKIRVETSGSEATAVTITFFARRVRIGHADELLIG